MMKKIFSTSSEKYLWAEKNMKAIKFGVLLEKYCVLREEKGFTKSSNFSSLIECILNRTYAPYSCSELNICVSIFFPLPPSVIWLDIHGAFHLSYSTLSCLLLDSFNIGFNWASIQFNRINIDKISKAISLQSSGKNCVNTSEKDFFSLIFLFS